jgi:hypothetical protein
MVRVFIEGGGDDSALKTECRRAFTRLFEKAGLQGRMPRPIACGGRTEAFHQFCTALDEGGAGNVALLLVDAEAPVTRSSPWEHVKLRDGDGWDKPEGSSDDDLHLMVQCMEAWFLADRAALVSFYGQGFNANALPASTANPENASKGDLYSRLESATRGTKTKGRYGKGSHSFKLLASLDPKRVREACASAERFFATLDRLTK